MKGKPRRGFRPEEFQRYPWSYLFGWIAGGTDLPRMRGATEDPLVGRSPIDPVMTRPFGREHVSRVYLKEEPPAPMPMPEEPPWGGANVFRDGQYRIAGRLRDGRFFYICRPLDVSEAYINPRMRNYIKEADAIAVVASSFGFLLGALTPAVRKKVRMGMKRVEACSRAQRYERTTWDR